MPIPVIDNWQIVGIMGDVETMPDRLIRLMAQRGLTQYGLAQASKLSPSTIHKILAGKTTRPGHETLRLIASALGVAITELVPDGDMASVGVHTDHRALLWERFAAHFKAGDPEQFAETVANLPKSDQAMLVRMAKLLELEQHIG